MTYVLETKNLKKKYKNTQALDGVDIKLEKGNIYLDKLEKRNFRGKEKE